MTPDELNSLAFHIDREASIADRPGQMERLETIARKLRDFAAECTTEWGLRIDGHDKPRHCTEHAAWLAAPDETPVSRVVCPWQDTTPNPPAQTPKETNR